MEISTIKVNHADGFMLINQSDFDPAVHVVFDEKPPVEEVAEEIQEAPAVKPAKKRKVTDGDHVVERPGAAVSEGDSE